MSAGILPLDELDFHGKNFYQFLSLGECWLGSDEANFKRDGATSRCVDNKFDVCDIDQKTKCRAQLCAGKWKANKVYELKQGNNDTIIRTFTLKLKSYGGFRNNGIGA